MYLKVGTITKQVGLKGEVKVFSTTSFAKKRFEKGNIIFIKNGNKYEEITVKTFRILNSDFYVVSFEEYPNLESTNVLLKKDLFALKDNSILDENQFFYSDLIGSSVFNENNEKIGEVLSIEEFPAQTTLCCKKEDGAKFYVPFIPQFILKIDIENKSIVIKIIEGLLWNLKF